MKSPTGRLDRHEVELRLRAAFAVFLDRYRELGGHRYYGFNDFGDPRNYKGPLIWSEGDCQLHFARALEDQFPGMVHLEMPVGRYTIANYDPAMDKRQFIDIVVSDLNAFDPEHDEFTKHRHDVFIEVKYIGKSGPRWQFDSRKKIPAIHRDALRLDGHLSRGNCTVAAVLVVDDTDMLATEAAQLGWPDSILGLVASPANVARLHGAELREISHRAWRILSSKKSYRQRRRELIELADKNPEYEMEVAGYIESLTEELEFEKAAKDPTYGYQGRGQSGTGSS